MSELFLQILNMSITASPLVLAVIVLRLILKKAPKWIMGILWALVGIRLVFPFSIESIFSIVPDSNAITDNLFTAYSPTISSDSYASSTGFQEVNEVAVNANNANFDWGFICSITWAVGIFVMLAYVIVSCLRIHSRLHEAVCTGGNVWICDRIESPFIFGFFAPKIYIPSSIDSCDKEYVIAHERAHINRKDFIWKPLGFLLLSVYWFNPVLWVAYILLCRDIELACDERVIRTLKDKKAYSTALVNCSSKRPAISACPLAFGEVGVKSRIRNVLNYKKPALWIIIAGIVACCVVSVVFMTNQNSSLSSKLTSTDDKSFTFKCYGSVEPLPPTVSFYTKDKSCNFNYSTFSSTIIHGKYSVDGDRVTIIDSDNDKSDKYVFIVKNSNTLVFDKRNSADIPRFKYSENGTPQAPIVDGSEFKLCEDDIKATDDNINSDSSEKLLSEIEDYEKKGKLSDSEKERYESAVHTFLVKQSESFMKSNLTGGLYEEKANLITKYDKLRSQACENNYKKFHKVVNYKVMEIYDDEQYSYTLRKFRIKAVNDNKTSCEQLQKLIDKESYATIPVTDSSTDNEKIKDVIDRYENAHMKKYYCLPVIYDGIVKKDSKFYGFINYFEEKTDTLTGYLPVKKASYSIDYKLIRQNSNNKNVYLARAVIHEKKMYKGNKEFSYRSGRYDFYLEKIEGNFYITDVKPLGNSDILEYESYYKMYNDPRYN